MYRNAAGFGILILYPRTLLYSLMSSYSFLVSSSGPSLYSIISSENSGSFISSFPIWILFYFSHLIFVARTSNTLCKKRGESGRCRLVPDLKINAFSFSPLNIIFSVGFSYMAFIMFRYVFTMLTFCGVFFLNYKWLLNFIQKLFLHLLRWLYGFYSIC